MDNAPIAASPQQCVTASELVRNFGAWQDRAVRAPVYVLNRGRPRLVLTSLEVMDALCAPHIRPDGDVRFAALLAALPAACLTLDAAGIVTAVNPAALARFGAAAMTGRAVADMPPHGPAIAAAAARVAASGEGETLEFRLDDGARRVNVAIAPFPDGTLVRVDDVTAGQILREQSAVVEALGAAANAAGASAGAVLGLSGYLAARAPTLARLLGVDSAALASVRFVTLAATADRVALGEAIEGVVAAGTPRALTISLIAHGAATLRARVGLAAVTGPAGVVGVAVSITAQP